METLLNTQSGLLGVSGLTNDMRGLESELTEHDDRRVRLAIEIFCYRARKYIGAFLACMQGADAVVFTGGIGENSPDIRARICAGMEWAGLKIDDARNQQTVGREGLISTDDSKLLAYAIPTDEELLIARDTVRVIEGVASSFVATFSGCHPEQSEGPVLGGRETLLALPTRADPSLRS